MFFDNLSEFFAPMQIILVLIIALVLFGPKGLPEIGKQIGTALRELNKAKNDMMSHFTAEHEPDPEPYPYSYPSAQSAYTTSYQMNATPDLTDYTIASPSVPPAIIDGAEGAETHPAIPSAHGSTNIAESGKEGIDHV